MRRQVRPLSAGDPFTGVTDVVFTCRSPDFPMEITEVTLVLTQRAKNRVQVRATDLRLHDLVDKQLRNDPRADCINGPKFSNFS